MTVCIAALAQWYDTNTTPPTTRGMVVLASDRMITYANVREYELQDQTKTFHFNDRTMILVSGYTEALLEVCRNAWVRNQDAPVTRVADIAELIAEEFRKFREIRNERRVLSRYGMTMDDYLRRQKDLAADVRANIEDALDDSKANVGGDAIVAGVDDRGAHIYVVTDPGDTYAQNAAGFCAIGIGSEHAESVFMAAQYTSKRFWIDAVILTYQAKKRAQVAPGVGESTDFYWITDTGISYYPPLSPFQAQLQRVYAQRQEKEIAALAEDRALLLLEMERADATPNVIEGKAEARASASLKADATVTHPDEEEVSGSSEEGGAET